MDPGGFLLPEVSIFCHRPDEPPTNNADVPAGRQLSISIDSLVRLMLHKEPLEVQDRLASKAIALLQPETFVAPTCVFPLWRRSEKGTAEFLLFFIVF